MVEVEASGEYEAIEAAYDKFDLMTSSEKANAHHDSDSDATVLDEIEGE